MWAQRPAVSRLATTTTVSWYLMLLQLLAVPQTKAAVLMCGDPGLPCEYTFTDSCLELLTQGKVTTSDLLRDDVTTGGCTMCVPPGGSYSEPQPVVCEFCQCATDMYFNPLPYVECFGMGVAPMAIYATTDSGECPLSEYADADFTLAEPEVCPTREEVERALNCAGDVDVAVPTGQCRSDVPGTPCEIPYASTCVDLLSTGEVKTTDILLDDTETGGCILCVPPGGSFEGPESCPTCECMDTDVACFDIGSALFAIGFDRGECPPSDYTNFTNFTVTSRCKGIEDLVLELNCDGSGGGGGNVTSLPSCDGAPGVPCEIPYASSCVDLLTTGDVTTDDILRDDESTGGCILCVPPGMSYYGPELCGWCSCVGTDVACVGPSLSFIDAMDDAGECPPSEYENFTNFTNTRLPCKTIDEYLVELQCDVMPVMPEPPTTTISPPPVLRPVKPAKTGKQQQQSKNQEKPDNDEPEEEQEQAKPTKPSKPTTTKPAKPDKPAKMPKDKRTKGERI